MQNLPLTTINIHQLLEKCKSKKELYRFLQYDCQAYLPKAGSANVYFFKQILKGDKNYLNREQVKVASVPQIEGLTVHDFLDYAKHNQELLKYLPDERDWLHLDRQWLIQQEYSKYIDNAIKTRQQKIEQAQNMTISLRPEFVQALQQCVTFSNNKGRSVFLQKDSSKRKRTRNEIEEVKLEEEILNENKQDFLREHKRLKTEQQELQQKVSILNNNQDILNQLVEIGVINENGEIQIEQRFDI